MKIDVGDYVWIMTWETLQKIEKITLSKVYFSKSHWVNREALCRFIKDGCAKVFVEKKEEE